MPQRVQQGPTDHPRVLVVDDDADLLDAMSEWIQARCGATVTSFASAEEAMRATQPDSFDVCVLDYCLDGVNGLTLGAMLREINPEARLILVSGGMTANIESLAIEHGFGRVFSKPISPEKLAEAIVS